jgi:hypothetical protein
MPIACRGQASKWLQHLDAQAAVAEQPYADDQRAMPVVQHETEMSPLEEKY